MRVAAALLTAGTLGAVSGLLDRPDARPCAITVRGGGVTDDLALCEVLAGSEFTDDGWFLELSAYRRDGSTGVGVHLSFPGRPVVGERYGFDTQQRGIAAGTAERFVVPTTENGLKLLPVATHRAEWRVGHSAGSSLRVVFSSVPPKNADGRARPEVHGTVDATLAPEGGTGSPVTIHGTF